MPANPETFSICIDLEKILKYTVHTVSLSIKDSSYGPGAWFCDIERLSWRLTEQQTHKLI